MAIPAPKRAKIAIEAVPANEVVQIRLLPPGATDVSQSLSFFPEMSHQVFGDDEELKGYANPHIDIWMSQTSFEATVDFTYLSKQPGADKVIALLEEVFPAGFSQDTDGLMHRHARSQSLSTEELGTLLGSSCTAGVETCVYQVNLSQAAAAVKDLHLRIQPLLLFFIDGATVIDANDLAWDILLAVRKLGDESVVVGFCTLYNFYAYPDRTRLRVSQILVLPPYQRQGVGKLLLQSVYQLADIRQAQDVTYEEPTEEVQALREQLELQRAIALSWLSKFAAQAAAGCLALNGHDSEWPSSSLALPADHVARAQHELRVTKQQVRLAWEALLLRQPAFQAQPGVSLLRGLIARRLVASITDAKKSAVGKRIFDLKKGFVMRKVSAQFEATGMPVALEDDGGGTSAEAKEAALDGAVERRMDVLSQRVACLAVTT